MNPHRHSTLFPSLLFTLAGWSLLAAVGCQQQDEPQEQLPASIQPNSRLRRTEPAALRYFGPFTSVGLELCAGRIGSAYRSSAAWPGPNAPVQFAGLEDKSGLTFPDSGWTNDLVTRLAARWITRIQPANPQPSTRPADLLQLRLVLARTPDKPDGSRPGWERLTLDVLLLDHSGQTVWTFRYAFWLDTTAWKRSTLHRQPARVDDSAVSTLPPRSEPTPPRPVPTPRTPTATRPRNTASLSTNHNGHDPGEWHAPNGWSYLLDSRLEGRVQIVRQTAERQGGKFVVVVTMVNATERPLTVQAFITVLDGEGRFVDETPRRSYPLEPNVPFLLRIESSNPSAARFACGIDGDSK